MTRSRTSFTAAVLSLIGAWLTPLDDARAYPVFARAYEVSCSTCHVAIPRRNDFGDAFRKAGYRMPVPDVPVVAEGIELDEANPALPKTIHMQGNSLFEGEFPAAWIFGAVGQLTAQYTNDEAVDPAFGIGTPNLDLVFGAALAKHISVLGEWNVRVPPSQFFLHLARLFDTPALNVLAGRFEQTKTLFRTNDQLLSPYRIDTANINGYVMGEPRYGVELNGIFARRLFYAAGVSQEDTNGPNFHGHYHLSFRPFGLDFFGEPADTDLEGEGSWTDELSLTLGQWGTLGQVGNPGEDPTSDIRRLGLDGRIGWRRLSLWSGIMVGLDENLVVQRQSASMTGFAEFSYALTDWLVPLYVYQYQDTATARRMYQSHEVGMLAMVLENLRIRLLAGFTDDKLDNEIVELQIYLGI